MTFTALGGRSPRVLFKPFCEGKLIRGKLSLREVAAPRPINKDYFEVRVMQSYSSVVRG